MDSAMLAVTTYTGGVEKVYRTVRDVVDRVQKE